MRNYVNFRGRARRREFWMFTLFNTLVYLLLLAVGLVLLGAVIYKSVAEGGDAAEHATAYTLAVAGLLLLVYGWMLATFLPGLAVRVRRLHDIGLSGKWLLGYYALYWVCFYWMSTSYMQFAEDGALEGLSGQQSAAAIWIVVRPMLLALALLSAAGIAAMCIGSEKGENRYGADPTAEIPAANKKTICIRKRRDLSRSRRLFLFNKAGFTVISRWTRFFAFQIFLPFLPYGREAVPAPAPERRAATSDPNPRTRV